MELFKLNSETYCISLKLQKEIQVITNKKANINIEVIEKHFETSFKF